MPPIGSVPSMKDGFRTLVTFANAGEIIGGGVDLNNLRLWIKEIPLPGWDGGGPIPQSTMLNAFVETAWHRSLVAVPPMQVVAAYAGMALYQMAYVVNRNLRATFTSPRGMSIGLNLFIDKFIPNAHKHGEQPTAQVTMIFTGIDSTLAVESPPQYVNMDQ